MAILADLYVKYLKLLWETFVSDSANQKHLKDKSRMKGVVDQPLTVDRKETRYGVFIC